MKTLKEGGGLWKLAKRLNVFHGPVTYDCHLNEHFHIINRVNLLVTRIKHSMFNIGSRACHNINLYWDVTFCTSLSYVNTRLTPGSRLYVPSSNTINLIFDVRTALTESRYFYSIAKYSLTKNRFK